MLTAYDSVNYEMPKSTHIHKSMLLRGVKSPAPKLDNADIEATRGRANHSGRSYGGAPLRGGYRGKGGRGNINGNHGSHNNGQYQNSYGGYSDSHAAQVGQSANGYQQYYANSYPPSTYQSGHPPLPGTGWAQPPPPGTYHGNYNQRR